MGLGHPIQGEFAARPANSHRRVTNPDGSDQSAWVTPRYSASAFQSDSRERVGGFDDQHASRGRSNREVWPCWRATRPGWPPGGRAVSPTPWPESKPPLAARRRSSDPPPRQPDRSPRSSPRPCLGNGAEPTRQLDGHLPACQRPIAMVDSVPARRFSAVRARTGRCSGQGPEAAFGA